MRGGLGEKGVLGTEWHLVLLCYVFIYTFTRYICTPAVFIKSWNRSRNSRASERVMEAGVRVC